MRKRDYDTMYNKSTGGTENQRAVDDEIKESDFEPIAYEEGFAAASGVRQETAETGGRIKYPEAKDAPRPNPIPSLIEKENAGLADTADE
jgi:hypothetical protein